MKDDTRNGLGVSNCMNDDTNFDRGDFEWKTSNNVL